MNWQSTPAKMAIDRGDTTMSEAGGFSMREPARNIMVFADKSRFVTVRNIRCHQREQGQADSSWQTKEGGGSWTAIPQRRKRLSVMEDCKRPTMTIN